VEKRRVRLALKVEASGDPEPVTDSGGQTTNPVVAKLRSWSANAIEEVIEYRGDTTIVVPRKVLRSVAEQCRDIEELKFNLLTDATCLDRYPLEPRFELNYQLISIPLKQKLTIRVKLSGSDPVIDSLFPVWKGANWLEREVFDMFGIQFTGHPDLRRILLPDDWEGHPLRKDYPVEGYRDIPAIATRYTRSRP
jgi:NADH-quinone oxidoreductase subunit C